MPAPVINGLVTYISDQLNVTVWDGEVPRQGTDGTDITPETPQDTGLWPAINVVMPEAGLDRELTFEDAWIDSGDLSVVCWATTREDLEGTTSNGGNGLLTRIEALLNIDKNVANIPLGLAPNGDAYYVAKMNFKNWTCYQEQEVRTNLSQLLYHGRITYEIGVHGMTPSRAS